MSKKLPPRPTPRLTVVTLGVGDMRKSIAFYEALGFKRVEGEEFVTHRKRFRAHATAKAAKR